MPLPMRRWWPVTTIVFLLALPVRAQAPAPAPEKGAAPKAATGAPAAAKAAAGKSAAEKAAAEKSAAEKGAAEKAAVEKSAAGKGAAEKSAAEKGAAEKSAAEKAAVEKSAAGKDLLEKGPAGTASADEPVAEAPAPAAAPAEPARDLRDPLDVPKAEPPPGLGDAEELSLGWTLFRTLVVLGMVVALAWLTLNVGLRRLLGIKGVVGGPGVVSVLERVPLDQKRSLFVVKAANEILLIGGSENSLELITRLDAAEVERLRTRPAPPLQMSPFLQKLLKRKDAPPPPAT